MQSSLLYHCSVEYDETLHLYDVDLIPDVEVHESHDADLRDRNGTQDEIAYGLDVVAGTEEEFGRDDDLSLNEAYLTENSDSLLEDEGDEFANVDRDWKIFPLVLTAADDVCVKLNGLIRSGKIPQDKIFYKYLKDMVHILIDYNHEYDHDVVQFFNTIEHLGGGSTVNFIRGPMYHGQGRCGARIAENAKFNLGGPSKTTRDKLKGGYTTKSGVLKNLHLAFLKLASEGGVPPLLYTEIVKVIGIAMENDGTAIKPGIQFDERLKRNVGLKQSVNLKFVRENPSPSPEFLRENVITEVNVSFITSLCNTMSMPVAVSYHTRGGKTGEDMKELLLGQIQTLQGCKACLEHTPSDELTVDLPKGVCCSTCEDCLINRKLCNSCADKNQPNYSPGLRACDRCLRDGKQCVRCLILVLITDCEEGNKKAMDLIGEMQEDKTIDPALEYLSFFPDSVHVGKSLKCSFCNWFILLNGERGCLSVIQTLRDDSNPDVRKKLRKLLKSEDVQNKDRMAVDPIIRLSSPEVLTTLDDINNVVHQLIPEKYRFSDSNKPGMFPHPVAICCGKHGKLMFLDLNPVKNTTRIVEADFHNPVRLKVIKAETPESRSLCYLNGTGTAVICCHKDGVLQVVDMEDRVKLKVSRLRDRTSLVKELEKRDQSCTGTMNSLKERLQACLVRERSNYEKQGKMFDIIHLDRAIHPSAICVLSENLLGCSCDTSREVYTIDVYTNGHFLCGKVNKLANYSSTCEQVQGMCLTSCGNLVLAHKNGISKLCMSDNVMEDFAVCSESEASPEIHSVQSVAPLPDGAVAFTDQVSRQVKQLKRNGTIEIVAGTGEESNKNGTASFSAFGQPLGLCTEGPNIFVTDAQIGTVKLITTITGTVQFLRNLGELYGAFSVHLKNKPTQRRTLSEAQEMVKNVSIYLNSTVAEVQEVRKSSAITNGPEGTVASKTVKSVQLVEKGLRNLNKSIAEINPSFKIEPQVCLTMQVESHHAVSHFKHPTCTPLEYARDFGNAMHESLKRTSKWAAYYFTHRKSYYPIPENNIALKDIPKMAQLPANKMSECDQLLMREWAQEHGQAVRQRTVRQNNTKYASGTLPLNMYEKNLPVGERVIFENDDQQSEYDSDSDEEDAETTNEDEHDETDDTLKDVAVNFLSKSIHTRSGRVITLSNRALSSYQ